jgi:IS605 OrfB family transposase
MPDVIEARSLHTRGTKGVKKTTPTSPLPPSTPPGDQPPAKKVKEPDPYLHHVLRMEIVTAVNRTAPGRAPTGIPPDEKSLQPFGSVQSWVPKFPRYNKDGTKSEEVARSPFTVFQLCMEAIQQRFVFAANDLMVAMWIDKRLPPEKRRPRSWHYPFLCNLVTELFFGTQRPQDKHQRMKDFTLKRFSGGFINSMQQRLTSLFSTEQKKNRYTVPVIRPGLTLYARPDTWRFTRSDGLNLAVNLDGTWWELGLGIPRGKNRSKKTDRDRYVMSTLHRVHAGEHLRGVPVRDGATGKLKTDVPVPTRSAWGPGVLGIQKKKGKWYALIEYRHPKPAPLNVPNQLVVHCGLRNFAVALTLDEALNRGFGIWASGDEVEHAHHRFSGRRRAIAHAERFRYGGRGHASNRIRGYQSVRTREMDTREHEWKLSFCRRVAKRIVRHAVQTKSTVWFMDLKDIRKRVEFSDLPKHTHTRVHRAPWFMLRTMIAHAAEKAGIPVKLFTPWYHTKRCPNCGKISEAAVDYRKWRYLCAECDYSGDLDRVAVSNAFIDLNMGGAFDFPNDSEAQRTVQGIRDSALLAGLDKPVLKVNVVDAAIDSDEENDDGR